MQNNCTKKCERMAPNQLENFKKTEAARIEALRNKKQNLLAKQKQNQNKEKLEQC